MRVSIFSVGGFNLLYDFHKNKGLFYIRDYLVIEKTWLLVRNFTTVWFATVFSQHCLQLSYDCENYVDVGTNFY